MNTPSTQDAPVQLPLPVRFPLSLPRSDAAVWYRQWRAEADRAERLSAEVAEAEVFGDATGDYTTLAMSLDGIPLDWDDWDTLCNREAEANTRAVAAFERIAPLVRVWWFL